MAAYLLAEREQESKEGTSQKIRILFQKGIWPTDTWYLNLDHISHIYLRLFRRLSDSPPWMFLTLFLFSSCIVLSFAIRIISSFGYWQNQDPWNLVLGREVSIGIFSISCNATEYTTSEIGSSSLGGQKPSLCKIINVLQITHLCTFFLE